MKRILLAVLIYMIMMYTISCKPTNADPEYGTEESFESSAAFSQVPLAGSHAQLNLIGSPNGKFEKSDDNGTRYFVPANEISNIYLLETGNHNVEAMLKEFSGKLILAHPDADTNGIADYTLLLRPLGKPGGTATITLCATDPITGSIIRSAVSFVANRNTGRPLVWDASETLFFILADLNHDGAIEKYPLFDDRLKDYFWQYNDDGLKLLQLRSYHGSI